MHQLARRETTVSAGDAEGQETEMTEGDAARVAMTEGAVAIVHDQNSTRRLSAFAA